MGHRSVNHIFNHFAIVRGSFTTLKLGKLLANTPLLRVFFLKNSLKHGQEKTFNQMDKRKSYKTIKNTL